MAFRAICGIVCQIVLIEDLPNVLQAVSHDPRDLWNGATGDGEARHR
jgi:hypothetical protein